MRNKLKTEKKKLHTSIGFVKEIILLYPFDNVYRNPILHQSIAIV